jgi:hypothetical protein
MHKSLAVIPRDENATACVIFRLHYEYISTKTPANLSTNHNIPRGLQTYICMIQNYANVMDRELNVNEGQQWEQKRERTNKRKN